MNPHVQTKETMISGADPELKRRGCTLKGLRPKKAGKVTNSCLSPTYIKVDNINL